MQEHPWVIGLKICLKTSPIRQFKGARHHSLYKHVLQGLGGRDDAAYLSPFAREDDDLFDSRMSHSEEEENDATESWKLESRNL